MSRTSGIVRWFNEIHGIGLIRADSGIEVSVYFKSIRGEGYRCLESGDRVEFTIAEGSRGLKATDVVLLNQ